MKNKERTLTCPECGKEFIPHSARQKYCSSECQIRHNNKRYCAKLKKKPKQIKICPVCGKTFTAEMRNQKYCGPACAHEVMNYKRRVWRRRRETEERIRICANTHDNCFSCDTLDGECRFD